MTAPLTSRSFHTPAFRITLGGRDTGRDLIADVLEVSLGDDVAAIDSFEFTLHDWDPVALRPRYSSPWDEQGTPLRRSPDGTALPAFEPGAQVELYLGYLDDGELPRVMAGEIVSVTASFPASGVPTCRIRALDALQRRMQRTEVRGNYSGTTKEIVEKLCRENDVDTRWATIDAEGKAQDRVEVDGFLYDYVARAADELGLSLFTLLPEDPDAGEDPVLYLARAAAENDTPVVRFVWGRTLVAFSPVLSTAAQVSEVVVRGSDPAAKDGERAIEETRSWSDLGLRPGALGPAAATSLDASVGKRREIITPREVTSVADAEKAALAHLRKLAETLITGSGSSVGLPELRAGRTVTMVGMGARFDGDYRLTRTNHTLGGGGYTTTFEARKVVLA